MTGNATDTESGSLRQRKEKLLYVSFVIVTGDAVSDRKTVRNGKMSAGGKKIRQIDGFFLEYVNGRASSESND